MLDSNVFLRALRTVDTAIIDAVLLGRNYLIMDTPGVDEKEKLYEALARNNYKVLSDAEEDTIQVQWRDACMPLPGNTFDSLLVARQERLILYSEDALQLAKAVRLLRSAERELGA